MPIAAENIADVYPELMGIIQSLQKYIDRGPKLKNSADFDGFRQLAMRLESLRYLLLGIKRRPYEARVSKVRSAQISQQVYDEALAFTEDSYFKSIFSDQSFRLSPSKAATPETLKQLLPASATFDDAMKLFVHLVKDGRKQGSLFDDDPVDPLIKLRDIIPDQQVGPAQFDIVADRLVIIPQPAEPLVLDMSNIAAAFAALANDGDRILAELTGSNCDRKLVDSVQRMQTMLRSERNIVQLGLANIGCGMLHTACEQELSDSTSAMLRSYTAGIGMYVEQFPDWRRFADNTATARIEAGDAQRVSKVLEGLIDQSEKRPDIVDEEVPKTLRFLRSLLTDPKGSSKKGIFAAVRTIENLVAKIFGYGIDFVEDTVKSTSKGISKTASTLVVAALLTIAAQNASALAPVAARLGETPWMADAAKIISKHLKDLAG